MNNRVNSNAARVVAERYRLDELIKDGPKAQVWRGLDTTSGRNVVVKLFQPDQIKSVEAFSTQMRRIATIRCPGLLPLCDFGFNDDAGFVVYELIEGGSLRDYVSRQIISKQQIIRWMIDAGEALGFIHSLGIVHRNIKPTNILIDLDGQAVVTDFGLGDVPEGTAQGRMHDEELKYFSPEQVEGKPIDARSDLYSLGVVLHELLTGHLPYQPTGPHSLRFEIIRGARPEFELISSELRSVCQKCLARLPQARYQTADEFVNDLRRALAGTTTRRWAVATAGVILFLAGFAVSGRMWRESFPVGRAEKLVTPDWIEMVRHMSARDQLSAVTTRLKELNPLFDGEVQETIENDVIQGLIVYSDHVRDISPVTACTGLKSFSCSPSDAAQSAGKLYDLSPLKGLLLTSLTIHDNDRLADLSPLHGMPLTFLDCGHTSISDLSPLRNCPLEVLVCPHTNVADLSPLAGLKLRELYCDHTAVKDLSPLEGMPLGELHCEDTSVADLTPLRRSPLKVLDCYRTQVSDLNPLSGQQELISLNLLSTRVEEISPLKELRKIKLLWCDFDEIRDKEILKSLNSLQFINDNPVSVFWQEASR